MLTLSDTPADYHESEQNWSPGHWHCEHTANGVTWCCECDENDTWEDPR